MVKLKKILNKIKVKNLNIHIYKLIQDKFNPENKEFKFELKVEENKSKTKYLIYDNNTLVHRSVIFKRISLLKAINSSGHVIGDCYTNEKYRGKGIYPKMLNYIGKKYMNCNIDLFIIVDKTNMSSIRGIEKSGFVKFKSLEAKRFLNFFVAKKIKIEQKK